jgi:hypothetical protein
MIIRLVESLIKIGYTHIYFTDRIDPIRGIFDIFQLYYIYNAENCNSSRG